MTEPSDDADLEAFDRHRRRSIIRTALVGAAVATVLTVAAALAGGDGRAGAALWLLVTATGCAVAALYGVATALTDDIKDRRVSRARIAWTVGLFFLAAALMAMVAGVGG